MSLREELLACPLKTKTVEVDGKQITVRELTAAERETFLVETGKAVKNGHAWKDLTVYCIQHCVLDENEQPCFEKKDWAEIRQMPARITEKLATEILKFSELIPEDTE